MWGIPCGSHVHGLTIQARQDLVKAEKALEELLWVEPATGTLGKWFSQIRKLLIQHFKPHFHVEFWDVLKALPLESEKWCVRRGSHQELRTSGAERCHRHSEDGSRPIETIPAILTPECGLVALEKLHYQLMTPMKSVVWKDDFSIFLLFGTFQLALSGFPGPPRFLWNFWRLQGQLATEVWSEPCWGWEKGKKMCGDSADVFGSWILGGVLSGVQHGFFSVHHLVHLVHPISDAQLQMLQFSQVFGGWN